MRSTRAPIERFPGIKPFDLFVDGECVLPLGTDDSTTTMILDAIDLTPSHRVSTRHRAGPIPHTALTERQ